MRSIQTTSVASSISMIALGVIVMVGWQVRSQALTQIAPSFAAMQFNTALCFVLCGLSVAMLTFGHRNLSILFTVPLGLISSLTFFQYVFGFNSGIDLFFHHSSLMPHADFPGRMSPVSAFSLTLGATVLAMLALPTRNRWHELIAQYSGVLIASLGSVSILGYLTGSNLLEGWSQYIRVAAHTGLGMILLGGAIFFLSQPQTLSWAQSRTQLINKLVEIYTIMLFLLIAQIHSNRQTVWLFILLGSVLLLTHQRLKHSQKIADLEKIKALRSSRLASLGTMSSGIAHEIMNPVTIIQGFILQLPDCINDPDKLDANVKGLSSACNRISRIVGGLKKFSRSGEGFVHEVHSINEIIEEAIFLTGIAAKKHLTSVTLESRPQIFINCNTIEIEQVFVNLINNAIDAVKSKKERWVKILLSEDADFVTVRVVDSGPGLPIGVQNKLFEPFFTTKEVGEGTGLGLPISKGILDDHKATIDVVNDLPNTCFEIRFSRVETVSAAQL